MGTKLARLESKVRTADLRTAMPMQAPNAFGQGRGGRPWRRKRDAVLIRDNGMCQCETCKGMRLPADEVDHIIAISQGGTDDDSNLRAINGECHKAKTARESIAAQRGETIDHEAGASHDRTRGRPGGRFAIA